MNLKKYLKVMKKTLGISLSSSMEYRISFFLLIISVTIFSMILPLIGFLIYSTSKGIPGWKFEEFILMTGTIELIYGICHFSVLSMMNFVAFSVESGKFDTILIKPINSLFYSSFVEWEFDGVGNIIVGTFLVGWSLIKMNWIFNLINLISYFMLIFCGIMVLYSLIIIITSFSFVVMRIEILFELFWSLYSLTDWPLTIYGGILRFILTFVIPFGIAGFYPAEAILGRIESPFFVLVLVCVSFIFFGIALLSWKLGIRKYVSAGG